MKNEGQDVKYRIEKVEGIKEEFTDSQLEKILQKIELRVTVEPQLCTDNYAVENKLNKVPQSAQPILLAKKTGRAIFLRPEPGMKITSAYFHNFYDETNAITPRTFMEERTDWFEDYRGIVNSFSINPKIMGVSGVSRLTLFVEQYGKKL